MANRAPIHPGVTLQVELAARGLSVEALGKASQVPQSEIVGVVNGERPITPEAAIRFARAFGTSAEFWANLQRNYDIAIDCREANGSSP